VDGEEGQNHPPTQKLKKTLMKISRLYPAISPSLCRALSLYRSVCNINAILQIFLLKRSPKAT